MANLDIDNLEIVKDTLSINAYDLWVMQSGPKQRTGLNKRFGEKLAARYREKDGRGPNRIYANTGLAAHLIYRADFDTARTGDLA
jgi:hypothetical protein